MKKKLKRIKMRKQTDKKITITINGGVHFYNNNVPQIEPTTKKSWWSKATAFVLATAKYIVGF